MKTQVYNLEGQAVSEVDLPDTVFGREWNPDLVHQVVLSLRANARRPWAHAKGRGEVRGGGIKPWKQKGTGRARHGSIRSPIWVGGGVSHGPNKERSYEVKINKKMLRAAVWSVLSKRLADGELRVVELLPREILKTKDLVKSLSSILSVRHALLISPAENKNIYRASRNIPRVKSVPAASLNVIDLLKFRQILMDKSAVDEIVKTGGK